MMASELREEVAFFTVAATGTKRNGDRIGSEVFLKTTRAKIVPLSGTARMMAEQIQNTQPYKITTRWNPLLEGTGGAMIVWKGRGLKVHGNPTNVDARNRWLEFRAFEDSSFKPPVVPVETTGITLPFTLA